MKKILNIGVAIGLCGVTYLGYVSFLGLSESSYAYEEPLESVVTSELLAYSPTSRCERYERGTYRVGNQACIDQPPVLSTLEVLETLQPYMIDVEAVYDTQSTSFGYEPSKVNFDPGLVQLVEGSISSMQASNDQERMVIPKIVLAYNQLEGLKIVGSVRETVGLYGPCRLQNYHVAMKELDGYVLQPGEELNMNKLIANKPGYCTGGGGKYLFYSGVCGGSTQLFWNAVLHPFLEVQQRYAHSKWYSGFYGSRIQGDDASIYEWNKQLIIENTGDSEIVFKTFVRPSDGNTVLISAVESDQLWNTQVTREQLGPMSSRLSAVIYGNDTVIHEDQRDSHYYGIDTSVDETVGQVTSNK